MDMLQKYRDAEKLMPWNTDDIVLNGDPSVVPLDSDSFYYVKDVREGNKRSRRYVRVDLTDGNQTPLFDESKLKELAGELPETVAFSGKTVSFRKGGVSFKYDIEGNTLTELRQEKRPKASVSPDGKWSVMIKDENLVLVENSTGVRKQLTFDGEKNFCWGHGLLLAGYVEAMKKGGWEFQPEVVWSHDSKRFLTYKMDSRLTTDAYYLETCFDDPERVRPRVWSCKYPIPQDKYVPVHYPYVYTLETGKMEKADCEPIVSAFSLIPGFSSALWTPDDKFIYYIQNDREHKDAWVNKIDAETLKASEVMREHSDDFISRGGMNRASGFAGNMAVIENGKKFLWWSERDNEARYFLYDFKTGELLNAVTPRGVNAETILRIDEEEGCFYFYATCLDSVSSRYSDPYYHGLCKASFDGSTFELLTPEDAEHKVTIIGKSFVDTYSRVDLAPVTVIRRLTGEMVATVCEADISDLMAAGYIIPKRFKVKARDGVTDLYGIVIPPKDLDETKTYPFVEYHYGGPTTQWVPKPFTWRFAQVRGREMFGGLEAYAQLGMAGVMLDGLSTNHRGHKIHAVTYHNVGDACGLPDHVAAGPQLKKMFPWLDITRVGIMGNSGGGFGTARALCEYGDYFKVGVASAGNHDQRLYNNSWSESFLGEYVPENYYSSNTCNYASGLKGKLLIVHGMLDDNVMITESLRLVQALIENNKDFDLLILPTWDHNIPGNRYFVRRKMDYFVKNLLGEEPPREYEFQK